jgi:hypothetical protein
MILNLGEEERRNDERSEELAKATNELASEDFLRSKNPTRTGKYIYIRTLLSRTKNTSPFIVKLGT